MRKTYCYIIFLSLYILVLPFREMKTYNTVNLFLFNGKYQSNIDKWQSKYSYSIINYNKKKKKKIMPLL